MKGIMERVTVAKRAERRFFITFNNKTPLNEIISVEAYKYETEGNSSASLPHLWKKHGFKNYVMPSYWSIDTYATDEAGLCLGKYNPTHKKDHKLNFDWVLEATPENLVKILEEIERRAFKGGE